MKSRTITGPSAWASYLINGDASGLEPGERAHVDQWLARELTDGEQIVSTVDDQEPRFTWSYRLYGGRYDGGDVIDYVALKA